MIKTTHNHNAGFFSGCSIKLNEIVKFINLYKKLPDIVDSSQQFEMYKNNVNNDVTFDYFENYNNIQNNNNIPNSIKYHWSDQFINYNNLDYQNITPLIKKYFSPSVKINEIINNLEKKYNINYDNTLAVYYRGTDKISETQIASFDDFYKQIIKIININQNIKILLQTDTAKFIDYINNKNLNNIIIINENKTSYTNKGIHNENSKCVNYNDMLYFLSTVIIISKCKYIICSSGNCSIWMILYRGSSTNIIQHLNGNWYNSIY
jgi:hypothetical protein